jgi:hypothetical protein
VQVTLSKVKDAVYIQKHSTDKLDVYSTVCMSNEICVYKRMRALRELKIYRIFLQNKLDVGAQREIYRIYYMLMISECLIKVIRIFVRNQSSLDKL